MAEGGKVVIKVKDNSSYMIEGDFVIVKGDGTTEIPHPGTKAGLCRCGHSEHKPMCDGSHVKAGFQSAV